MKFKKGHIIPRWCNVIASDRKAQHNLRFGCDVELSITGNGVVVIFPLSKELSVVELSKVNRKMRNGTVKSCTAIVRNIIIDFSKIN